MVLWLEVGYKEGELGARPLLASGKRAQSWIAKSRAGSGE